MTHKILAPGVALAVLMACEGGPTQPPLTGDIYVLESIAGVNLPAPYAPNPDFTGKIVADTFAFVDGHTGMRRTVYDGDVEDLDQAFSYTSVGEAIEITFECPPNASCIAGPHLTGTRTDGSMNITHSAVSRYPLVLRRLFPPD